MLHQDGTQRAPGCAPALYDTYEREEGQSWGERGQRVSVMYVSSSRRHTQCKHKQEKKRHEEIDTARASVAAYNAWDRASRNCESGVNMYEW